MEMKARSAVLSARKARLSILADWSSLQIEDEVEVLRDAHVLTSGRVEEVSPSGKVLWLYEGADVASRPYFKSDGVLVRFTGQVGQMPGGSRT